MTELTKYLPNVTIQETKSGVKVMKRTSDILNKHMLEENEPLKPLLLRCGYVGACKDRVNMMCGFQGKWCSQQVKE